jgi:hypothetical protein
MISCRVLQCVQSRDDFVVHVAGRAVARRFRVACCSACSRAMISWCVSQGVQWRVAHVAVCEVAKKFRGAWQYMRSRDGFVARVAVHAWNRFYQRKSPGFRDTKCVMQWLDFYGGSSTICFRHLLVFDQGFVWVDSICFLNSRRFSLYLWSIFIAISFKLWLDHFRYSGDFSENPFDFDWILFGQVFIWSNRMESVKTHQTSPIADNCRWEIFNFSQDCRFVELLISFLHVRMWWNFNWQLNFTWRCNLKPFRGKWVEKGGWGVI